MFWACLGFLSVAALFPLNAQDDDLKRLNFDLGGGFSVPLNPTARYFGVNGNFDTFRPARTARRGTDQ
jgi:hypothetical protein